MLKFKNLVSSFILSALLISTSFIQVQASGDPYQNVVPEMRKAVMETNETILKDKMNPRLRTTERWVLKSADELGDPFIGDTAFPATIPAATSSSQQNTKTITMNFSVTASIAEDISGIGGISYGATSSKTVTYSGPSYNDKLSNKMAANYAYVVGVSRFQVYEYTYEIQNSMGKVLRTEKERAVVHDTDSTYLLKVCEENVKVHVENAYRNRVMTWSSQRAYSKDLISTDRPDIGAEDCIFF